MIYLFIYFSCILLLLQVLIIKTKNGKQSNTLIVSENIHFIKNYIQTHCFKQNIDVLKNENVLKNLDYTLYSSKNRNNIMLIKKDEIDHNKYSEIISENDIIKDFDFVQKKKNPLHPNVFLINLVQSKERLEFMKFKLKNIQLSVRLVHAVNGYELKNNILSSKNKSLGSYGLLLTYEKILRYALENNLSEILILEDDIYFHKDFNNLFKQYNNLMEDKDIIYLGTSQTEFQNSENLFNYDMNEKYYSYGTYAIILKKKIISLLYHSLRNKNLDIDILINHLFRKHQFELNTLIFYPPLVIPEVRDSLNMGTRVLNDFLMKRRLLKIKNNYLYVNKYLEYHNIDNHKRTKKENKFCFIIPSYNNEEWVIKNIKSILYQNYTNYHIYYTNDMSTDNTLKKLNELVDEYHLKKRITIYNNSEKLYQGLSRYQMYMNENIKDEDILVLLDGDDFLYDSYVLNKLNDLYNQNKILMTYGKFLYWSMEKGFENIGGNKTYPKDIIKHKQYRNYLFITQHLRTMKKKIIKDIDKKQFYDWNGDIITCCTDLIESFHCLEKTDKHMNSGEILLIYNKTNSMKYENSYYRKENIEYKKKIEKYIRNNFMLD